MVGMIGKNGATSGVFVSVSVSEGACRRGKRRLASAAAVQPDVVLGLLPGHAGGFHELTDGLASPSTSGDDLGDPGDRHDAQGESDEEAGPDDEQHCV